MNEEIERHSKLGFPLHEQLGKGAILNLLLKSYLPFLSHYRMTKPAVNYHGLLGLLQTVEKDHQLQKEPVNLVGGSSVGRRSTRRGKKKKIQKSLLSISSRANCQKLTKARQSASSTRSWVIRKEIILLIQPPLTQTDLKIRERSKRLLHKVLI